jgi:hypothetical protein
VTARFADETDRGSVCPIEIEKREGGSVELCFAAMEFVVTANLALQNMSVDLVRFRFSFRKESHGLTMPQGKQVSDYKSELKLEANRMRLANQPWTNLLQLPFVAAPRFLPARVFSFSTRFRHAARSAARTLPLRASRRQTWVLPDRPHAPLTGM